MIRLLAILACLAVGSHAADTPVVLRVVTWNLKWFPGGRMGSSKEQQDQHIDEVRKEVRKLRADILILQEVGSAAALEETLQPLGPEWRVAVVSRFKQGNFLSGQQVAIAARMPAEAVWSEPWEKGWAGPPRGYAQATFNVGGKRLAVYGLHLKSNLGDPAENTSKREDAIGQLIAHLNTGRERMPKPDAVIIGGDFNTDDPDTPAGLSPGERTFSMLRQGGFNWSFDGIAHKDRITCPGSGRYPDACFDYFFTKGLGKPLSAVVKAEGSDHLPVVMDVEMEMR